MFNEKEVSLLAFKDELETKTAAGIKPPAFNSPFNTLHRAFGGFGAGAGLAGSVGAIGGGIHGAVKGYQENKDQGGAQKVWGTIGGAASGAMKGGLVGAGVGGAAGAAAGAIASPKAYRNFFYKNHDVPLVGESMMMGQRGVHALTGWTPEQGIRSIGGGSADAVNAFNAAKDTGKMRRLLEEGVEKGSPEWEAALKKHHEGVAQARKGMNAAREAESMGLTSLPGYVKAVRKHGLGEVMRADVASNWHAGGTGHKIMSAGVPLGFGAMEMASAMGPQDPDGPGRGERIGGAIGGIGAGLLGGSMPFAGNMLLGAGLHTAGKYVGRGVDKARQMYSRVAPQQQQQGYPEQHVPSGRVVGPGMGGENYQ